MAFTLPQISYSYDALEPHIDAKTMEIHHTKHHQAYVDKLNDALKDLPEYSDKTIEEVLKEINNIPENVRQAVINNGGGHANHSLFWKILTPGGSNQPKGELLEMINKLCGDFETFKTKMNEEGTKRFGSGWVWLVVKADGMLEHYSSANQDSPLMKGDKPILGIDVWEHAYYLNYQNKRPDYLNAIWNVINWDVVEELYQNSK